MRALGIALLVLLAGCSSPSQTVTDGAFSVTITGAPIDDGHATFSVRFTLDAPLTYNHPGCPPDLFAAKVEHGDGIPLGEYGGEVMFGRCAIYQNTLPAGTHTATFHWNGHDGVMDDGGPHGGDRVAAGSYDVRIWLRGDSGHETTVAVDVA